MEHTADASTTSATLGSTASLVRARAYAHATRPGARELEERKQSHHRRSSYPRLQAALHPFFPRDCASDENSGGARAPQSLAGSAAAANHPASEGDERTNAAQEERLAAKAAQARAAAKQRKARRASRDPVGGQQ